MPRRRKFSITLPTTLPTGFWGGVATGLMATTPYLQQPALRMEALERQLADIVRQQMDVQKELLRQQSELQRTLMKERSDILQQNILVKPTTPERQYQLLSMMAGRPVEPISLEEQQQFMEKGIISPDVVAIPRSAFLGFTQITGMTARLEADKLEEILKRAKLSDAIISSIIDDLIKVYGGMIPLPQYQIELLEKVKDLTELRKRLAFVLLPYFPQLRDYLIEGTQQEKLQGLTGPRPGTRQQ